MKSSDLFFKKIFKIFCQSYENSFYYRKVLTDVAQIVKPYGQLNELVATAARSNTRKRMDDHRSNASFLLQFVMLMWRACLNQMRESFATRIMGLQSVLIGLFLGFTYFQLPSNQSSIQNKNGLLFLLLMQISLACIFSSASVS